MGSLGLFAPQQLPIPGRWRIPTTRPRPRPRGRYPRVRRSGQAAVWGRSGAERGKGLESRSSIFVGHKPTNSRFHSSTGQ
ncbi:unnamed protein product [Caretta caretta]